MKGYRALVQFFRDGNLDPWGDAAKDKLLILPPVEQYLISKEKRLFKGFEEYNDITRLVYDLETTALEPKDGRIFMIGIKTNKGYQKVIECSNIDEERKGLVEFFNIIDECRPYGLNHEEICHDCAMKDEALTEIRAKELLFGEEE